MKSPEIVDKDKGTEEQSLSLSPSLSLSTSLLCSVAWRRRSACISAWHARQRVILMRNSSSYSLRRDDTSSFSPSNSTIHIEINIRTTIIISSYQIQDLHTARLTNVPSAPWWPAFAARPPPLLHALFSQLPTHPRCSVYVCMCVCVYVYTCV